VPTPETLARRVAKAAVFPAGLRRGRRRGDVVILLYHRIGSTGREVDVPSATFERHLRLLRSAGDAISLDDVRVGRGGVVVTFDDGYRDFTDTVVPLLVRYGVAGTLYLQTGLVTGDCEAVGERLDWAALSDAVTTGLVTIGAHTHTHADLARGSGVEAEDEMRRSQELIEDRLGRACDHFAYPYGIASEAADGAAR
jgi:peptidoglycan/xylan/chitin deacetylase (PgdA/CDA1 family)